MSQSTKTMHAVRIHPDPTRNYTPEQPAPVSALHLDEVPAPTPEQPGDILVQIKASTIIRDMLTWPEMLEVEYFIPGSDFSGVVVSAFDPSQSKFKPGDEVYGFGYFDSKRTGAWAEYSVLKENELALKPKNLDWAEAASVPLSALTAYQALFHHGKLDPSLLKSTKPAQRGEEREAKRVLITGATGALGLWLVQMAAQAGIEHVVAVTSSVEQSRDDLIRLGATEVIHYNDLRKHSKDSQLVIDTAGGSILSELWACASPNGIIVSVDSFTTNFVQENRKSANPREDVHGVWFIVEPSFDDLSVISDALANGRMETYVDQRFSLKDVREAYEAASIRSRRKGKVILTIP